MPYWYGLWNKNIIRSNGFGSSLLKTMKRPSGSHKSLVSSSLYASQSRHISNSKPENTVIASGYGVLETKINGFRSNLLKPLKNPCTYHQNPVSSSWYLSNFRHFSSFDSKMMVELLKNPTGSNQGLAPSWRVRLFGSQAAIEPATTDGLTVEGIIANEWTIHDECESDWKSHAAAVAQSIHLIKKRLQVQLEPFNPFYFTM